MTIIYILATYKVCEHMSTFLPLARNRFTIYIDAGAVFPKSECLWTDFVKEDGVTTAQDVIT